MPNDQKVKKDYLHTNQIEKTSFWSTLYVVSKFQILHISFEFDVNLVFQNITIFV